MILLLSSASSSTSISVAYASFLEWNSNPEIAEAASKLYYGDINNLELYGNDSNFSLSFMMLIYLPYSWLTSRGS